MKIHPTLPNISNFEREIRAIATSILQKTGKALYNIAASIESFLQARGLDISVLVSMAQYEPKTLEIVMFSRNHNYDFHRMLVPYEN